MKQDRQPLLQVEKLSMRLMTAIMIGVAFLSINLSALAQINGTDPGQPERVDGSQLRLQGSFDEARTGSGTLVEVWRAADSNTIFFSINNGPAMTYLNAQSFVSPTVVATGSNSFMILFVGTNNQINWGVFNIFGTGSGPWRQIPNMMTDRPVHAAQVFDSENEVLVVSHGLGEDNRVFSTFFGGTDWTAAETIQNGILSSEPSVAFDTGTNRFYAAGQGTNGHVWITNQAFGASQWAPWHDTGLPTGLAPSIGITLAGQINVAYTNPQNSQIRYVELNHNMDVVFGPVDDTWTPPSRNGTIPRLESAPQLTPVGNHQMYVLDNYDNLGYNKPIN
jgi:hypothetical protein